MRGIFPLQMIYFYRTKESLSRCGKGFLFGNGVRMSEKRTEAVYRKREHRVLDSVQYV